MYAHTNHMNLPKQIAGDEERSAPSAGEPIDNSHIPYEHHALDEATAAAAAAAAAGMGGVIEEIPPDAVYVPGTGNELVIPGGEDSSQLTLSFRGQVYVFDAVTPKKVHSVLLLLGGCELSSGGAQGVDMSMQNQRGGVVDFPPRCSQSQRAASLIRFRQKRKERCFEKKIRYEVRQEVAVRMQRNKGQFTSSKKSEGDGNWGSSQESGQEDPPQETSCTHCGTSSKSTPMMRRGPSGPRSLCNACGLFWANRGTLRDLSKRPQDHALPSAEPCEGVINGSDSGTSVHTHNSLVNFSNGDNGTLIAER